MMVLVVILEAVWTQQRLLFFNACYDNGTCIAVVLGCTDSSAFNYNSAANTDDGSCVAYTYGCTDSTAFNYDSSANTDNGSCIAICIYGCIDSSAFNYDSSANTDDSTCYYNPGCTDEQHIIMMLHMIMKMVVVHILQVV